MIETSIILTVKVENFKLIIEILHTTTCRSNSIIGVLYGGLGQKNSKNWMC